MFNLVDFDGYLVRGATANNWYKKHYKEQTDPTLVNYSEGMYYLLEWYIQWSKWFTETFGEADLFISVKKLNQYHRNLFYPEYKLSRSKQKNSVIIWRTLIEQFKTLIKQGGYGMPVHWLEGYEADDIVSIVAEYIKERDSKVRVNIHSIDKDLQTVPNTIMYSPTNPNGMLVDQQVVDESVKYQMVVGDVVDGYKGLKGHGPVSYKDNWSHLSNKNFKEQYIQESSKEHFELMRDLVKMLTLKSAKRLMPHDDFLSVINMSEVIYDRQSKET